MKLQLAWFAYNVKICISLFIRSLPPIPAFNTLCADLPRRIAAILDDHDYGAFIGLTNAVLELDTIFRLTPSSHSSCPPRISPVVSPPALAVTPTPLVPVDASRPPQRELSCGNCRLRGLCSTGHMDETCFQPGGGMEGRREEYMANMGCVHAMFAECLENALSSSMESLPPVDPVPTSSVDDPDLLDSDFSYLLLPTSVTPFSPNFDMCGDRKSVV